MGFRSKKLFMGDDTSVDKTGFTGDLADRRSAAQKFETGFWDGYVRPS